MLKELVLALYVLVEKLPGGGCAMQYSAMLLLCRKDQLKVLMDLHDN
jgi:hypothetical protein